MAVRIRKMEGADLAGVMALAGSLRDAPQWPRAAYVAAIEADDLLQKVALVAEDVTGEIAGYVVGTVIVPEAELESIAVACSFQRRGIGAGLLEAWSLAVRDAGASQIMLEVRASNQVAQRFYRRAGFVEAGSRPQYYRDPIEDAQLLCCNLGGNDAENSPSASGIASSW